MLDERGDSIEWTAVVDRFEGEWAIVVVGEHEARLELPRYLLPPGTEEGDHLRAWWELNPQARQDALERLRRLREELDAEDGDFDL